MSGARVAYLPGDGIGPEVLACARQAATLLVPDLTWVELEAGWGTFRSSGRALPDATVEEARRCQAILFGAVSSPSGPAPGYQSPIVALRRALGLYANVRPVRSLPLSEARPGLDLVIVREATEGLYSGREERRGEEAVAAKVVTRQGTQRIARFALELARREGRRVTVVHKANVLRVADGFFREVVLDEARAHPQVEVDEVLVDAAAALLVRDPARFQLLLCPNLYGDILSDLAAELAGGLALAPSASHGTGPPLFEPVHGSAPDIAGRGVANPAGALLSAALMLAHLGQAAAAATLDTAVRQTLEHGPRTADLGGTASTAAFMADVCLRLDEGGPPPGRPGRYDLLRGWGRELGPRPKDG